MKKFLIITAALLFGCTVFAQSNIDYPEYPYATYKCEKMITEAIPEFPYETYSWGQMNPDCFPPSAYASTKDYKTTPPVHFKPKTPSVKYNPQMMRPDYPSYPPVASPYKKQMLPY